MKSLPWNGWLGHPMAWTIYLTVGLGICLSADAEEGISCGSLLGRVGTSETDDSEDLLTNESNESNETSADLRDYLWPRPWHVSLFDEMGQNQTTTVPASSCVSFERTCECVDIVSKSGCLVAMAGIRH